MTTITEAPNYTQEQLSKLAMFLTASIHELNAGLQESAVDLSEEGKKANSQQLQRHAQILAAISGAAVSVALIMGVSSEDFGTLAKEMAAKLMAEFDSMQDHPIQ